MRAWIAAALIVTAASGAGAADLPRDMMLFDEAEEVAVVRTTQRMIVREEVCVTCSGHRLPLGGLRSACPPALRVSRSVVLRVKG
jgi:hypothetical protein